MEIETYNFIVIRLMLFTIKKWLYNFGVHDRLELMGVDEQQSKL